MVGFLERIFIDTEVPNHGSDASCSQPSSDEPQTTTSSDDASINTEELSTEVPDEDHQGFPWADCMDSEEELSPPKTHEEVIETKEPVHKNLRDRKRKINFMNNGRIVADEHLYYCNENDTCVTICGSWYIVGGADELIRLNSPYYGTKLTKRTKFKAGTRLRINESVENPGADLLEAAEDDEDDIVCSKCLQGHSPKNNRIVLCDGPDCNIALHKICANLKRLPRSFLCQPCENRKFVLNGVRPMECAGCGSSQANDPWELRAGQWFHIKCVGNSFVKQKRKYRTKEKNGEPCEDDKSSILDIEGSFMTNREEVRNDVWAIIMGAKLEGSCPVCGIGLIRKEKGGFDCAHVDYSRKRDDGSICRSDCWNLVPSCSQCNQMCGMRNMFDYMARRSTSRGLIRIIASKKLYCHLVQGYSSENAPSRRDLYNHVDNKGTLDFASFVADCYNTSHMEDYQNGLSYRELLYLNGNAELMFNRILQSKGILTRYVPEEWEI